MRTDGFDRMDVSTSVDDDPKFRALARRDPELYPTALAAYVGLLARSWREGERLTLEEGWPSLLPWDESTAEAMVRVGLVDDETRLPRRAWAAWFGAAADRRRLGRERQHRADVKRGRVKDPSDSPPDSQGRQARQAGSPSGSQSGPPRDQRRSNGGPVALHPPPSEPDDMTCPGCGELLRLNDTDVAADRTGRLWHRVCPSAVSA